MFETNVLLILSEIHLLISNTEVKVHFHAVHYIKNQYKLSFRLTQVPVLMLYAIVQGNPSDLLL